MHISEFVLNLCRGLFLKAMYIPTAKGYFSGCGGMELGMMQAGIKNHSNRLIWTMRLPLV